MDICIHPVQNFHEFTEDTNTIGELKPGCNTTWHRIELITRRQVVSKFNLNEARFFETSCKSDSIAPGTLDRKFILNSKMKMESRLEKAGIHDLRVVGTADLGFFTTENEYQQVVERNWQINWRIITQSPESKLIYAQLKKVFEKKELEKRSPRWFIEVCMNGLVPFWIGKRQGLRPKHYIGLRTPDFDWEIDQNELDNLHEFADNVDPFDCVLNYNLKKKRPV